MASSLDREIEKSNEMIMALRRDVITPFQKVMKTTEQSYNQGAVKNFQIVLQQLRNVDLSCQHFEYYGIAR